MTRSIFLRALPTYRAICRAQQSLALVPETVTLVEPLPWSTLLKDLKYFDSYALLTGVTSLEKAGPIELRLSNNRLGHSIIPTKPNLSGDCKRVWNFPIETVLDLAGPRNEHGNDDIYILRINAEGVENQIIEYFLDQLPLDRFIVMGSLGDLAKCFGSAEQERVESLLREYGIPFIYFTSNPESWATALTQLSRVITDRTSQTVT
jgi:hypothetical protein